MRNFIMLFPLICTRTRWALKIVFILIFCSPCNAAATLRPLELHQCHTTHSLKFLLTPIFHLVWALANNDRNERIFPFFCAIRTSSWTDDDKVPNNREENSWLFIKLILSPCSSVCNDFSHSFIISLNNENSATFDSANNPQFFSSSLHCCEHVD